VPTSSATALSTVRRLARPTGCLLLLAGARQGLPALAPALALFPGGADGALVRAADEVAAAGAWLAAAWVVTRALDAGVWSRCTPHPPRMLTDLVAASVWTAGGLAVAADVLGIPVASIVAASGVLVAVAGLALRDLLASLFAGIALGAERSYRIGDWLEVKPGAVGRVVEVGWLTTRLLSQDGVELVVPNSQLAAHGFANFNHPGEGVRDQATVTLGYEVSPARAERVLLAAAATVPAAASAGRAPDARIVGCDANGVAWQLRYWPDGRADRADVRHELHAAVLRHLYQAGLSPAAPRLDLVHGRAPAPAPGRRCRLDALLARSDLLGHLGPDELLALADAARRRRVEAGAAVVREGEAGGSLFVVLEGVLDVEIRARAGPVRGTRRLAPGDVFGEHALLTGAPRSATVTARTASLVCEIAKADLEPVLARRPEFAAELGRVRIDRQAERERLEEAAAAAVAPRPPPAPAPACERGLLPRVRALLLGPPAPAAGPHPRRQAPGPRVGTVHPAGADAGDRRMAA
jgi:small-conductance mechanosensitive channel/CRP-like cAMP-binding protein